MVSKDPFASIASKNGTAGKKSDKIAAAVTEKIKKEVDNVINLKAQIKKLTAELSQAEQTIIDHVQPQQEKQARAGNYSKSFYVEGKDGSLTYITSDRFTVPKDEEVHEALKTLLGKDFDNYLEYKRSVNLTKKIMSDKALLNKVIKIITDAGISLSDAFEVKDILVTQPGVDKTQYELPPKTLVEFRTLVKQNKPSLK